MQVYLSFVFLTLQMLLPVFEAYNVIRTLFFTASFLKRLIPLGVQSHLREVKSGSVDLPAN